MSCFRLYKETSAPYKRIASEHSPMERLTGERLNKPRAKPPVKSPENKRRVSAIADPRWYDAAVSFPPVPLKTPHLGLNKIFGGSHPLQRYEIADPETI